jgi:hypothetical protein
MSTKKNKILQNAPIGYYVVEYNPTDGLIKTPIISFVFYFENTQNDYETISTNYLTINDKGFDNCSRLTSNYNYIMHPNGLIYPANNTLDWQPMTEEEFISKNKLNYIKKIDNEFTTQYNTKTDTYNTNLNYNYNYQNDYNDYKNNTYDYVNRKWGEFCEDKTENNILDIPLYENFNYSSNSNLKSNSVPTVNTTNELKAEKDNIILTQNPIAPSHINFSDSKQLLIFNNKKDACEYINNTRISTINNNIEINGELYNCSCYNSYAYFYQIPYNENKTFTYSFIN